MKARVHQITVPESIDFPEIAVLEIPTIPRIPKIIPPEKPSVLETVSKHKGRQLEPETCLCPLS